MTCRLTVTVDKCGSAVQLGHPPAITVEPLHLSVQSTSNCALKIETVLNQAKTTIIVNILLIAAKISIALSSPIGTETSDSGKI